MRITVCASVQNHAAVPSRAARKRSEELVRLLDEIHRAEEPVREAVSAFCERYAELPLEERALLFDRLVRRLEKTKAEVEGPLRSVLDADDGDPLRWSVLLTELRRSLESPRLRAFRRFLHASGGLRFLIELRADLIVLDRQGAVDLEPLNEELAHLLNSWFQHGFLFLQEITSESSFRTIRFLKEHEMVHPMASLEEMGGRLGEDRRCFALVHRAMPDEPVVFIEAALCRGLARSIHDILDDHEGAAAGGSPPRRPTTRGDADTVIFYSINNTQNGLAGLGLGKLLVFRVVEAIRRDRPEVRTFATLSPIPGFWRRYLRPVLAGEETGFELERDELDRFVPERTKRRLFERRAERRAGGPGGTPAEEDDDVAALLLEVLDDPTWLDDPVYAELLERPLSELAYHYLTEETDRRGRPRNPVASFHLGNGARVSPRHVRFAANRSQRAVADSCGMMVNYVYQSTWLRQFSGAMQALLPWGR